MCSQALLEAPAGLAAWREQAMKLISLVGLVTAALAQPSAPAPAPATTPTFQGFGDSDKTCVAWTDECRLCLREADNTVVCSNIGIACQPAETRCTARREPAK
jgi:hypothetical protein